MKTLVLWQGKGNRSFGQVIEAESVEAARAIVTENEQEKHGSWFRIYKADTKSVIDRGSCGYVKIFKGNGKEVHISHISTHGYISDRPACGSGTCNYGFKNELRAKITSNEVTCKKCLARLEKLAEFGL